MNRITIDTKQQTGKIRPMHAVNNGPVAARSDQSRGNFDTFSALHIPYARNHDAAHNAGYGGEHIVDVPCIFPNFDADVDDPASYDFLLTDIYTKTTLDAGTKIFYRLGASIEHRLKKYLIHRPTDYLKWAKICEHIILHYNEGWADGHHWNIEYWEIWNEPDYDLDEEPNKHTWGGTKQEFFDFYKVAVTYLKNRFPNLKFGGPALGFRKDWVEDFFTFLTKDGERVPMDFFSWHYYTNRMEKMMARCAYFKDLVTRFGYGDTEIVVSEWNYVADWGPGFVDTILDIKGIKGAAFVAAVMSAVQKSNQVDMLMYYDMRAGAFNGVFNTDTLRPLKTWHVFSWFDQLYRLGGELAFTCDDGDLYVCAAEQDGKWGAMITYYTHEDAPVAKEIEITVNGAEQMRYHLLDGAHNGEVVDTLAAKTVLQMQPNTVIFLSNF